jgi:hypothetical protein
MSLTSFIVDREMANTSKPSLDLTNGSVLAATNQEVERRLDQSRTILIQYYGDVDRLEDRS